MGTCLFKQDGIDIDRIIEENGLNGNFEYGKNINITRIACKGKSGYKITEEEKKEAEKLGIVQIKPKKSIIAQTLEISKILTSNGINLSKIKIMRDGQYILLKEIKQDGIDIERIIIENRLDENFLYGKNIAATRLAYNGKGTYKKMTEEEKEEAEQLGIIKSKKRTSKEIAEASISSLIDIEMSDREDAVLKELVEKTKEGGMNLDEQS